MTTTNVLAMMTGPTNAIVLTAQTGSTRALVKTALLTYIGQKALDAGEIVEIECETAKDKLVPGFALVLATDVYTES